MKRFYFSVDVDYVPNTGEGVYRAESFGLTHGIPVAYFITGMFARTYPDIVRSIARNGDEIGIHGWDHGFPRSGEDFRSNSLAQQRSALERAMGELAVISGRRILMNRCPFLRVSTQTFRAMAELGLILDSSIPAGRVLGSSGSWSNLSVCAKSHWIDIDQESFQSRSKRVFELPPSAWLAPINMASLRLLGLGVVRWLTRVFALTRNDLVFYSHPYEFCEPGEPEYWGHRNQRFEIGSGRPAVELLGEYVRFVHRLGFSVGRHSELVDYCLREQCGSC